MNTKQQVRQFFAEGIRARRTGGKPDGAAVTICPEMGRFIQWAMRSLVMAGPAGRLP